MESTREIALVLANTFPHEGRNVYWVFSRKQIEYILTELESKGPGSGAQLMKARYLDEVLSVISLEHHFGLKRRNTKLSDKYIVTKAVSADGELKKTMLHSVYPVRMRVLNFSSTSISPDILLKNREDVLGCFTQGKRHLFIVPDLAGIIQKYSE